MTAGPDEGWWKWLEEASHCRRGIRGVPRSGIAIRRMGDAIVVDLRASQRGLSRSQSLSQITSSPVLSLVEATASSGTASCTNSRKGAHWVRFGTPSVRPALDEEFFVFRSAIVGIGGE